MGTLDAATAWLAAARWLVSLGAVLVIGAAAALLVVRRAEGAAVAAMRPLISARLARTAFTSAVLLGVALTGLLAGQAFSWFGPDAWRSVEPTSAMIRETRWGRHWSLAMSGCAVATLLTVVAAWWPAARRAGLLLAAGAVVLTTPLIGHGASHGVLVWLTHAAHLAGAGLWLGALAVASRATWVVWQDDSPSIDALRSLLAAFSPLALTGAGLLAASGALLSFDHVRPVDALWTTEYGRTLGAKLAVVAVVAALGWWNWRTLTPAIGHPSGPARLRRAVTVELVLSLGVVLALTGWLAGLPVPAAF